VLFRSETAAFKAVIRHAGAILGIGRNSVTSSGWASQDVKRDDPVDVALTPRLQHSAMAHVAGSTSKEYVGPWNKIVKWCGKRLSERCPLPAADFTVVLYFQSVEDRAKTFAPVKSHSAAIAFFEKMNFSNNVPTQSPVVCMVRQAAIRKFGLSPKNRKAPFKRAEVVMFATAYGVLHQGYCHLVTSSMAVLMFGGLCRYSDVSRLRWRNLQFDIEGNLDVTFDHGCRKNSQFRQGATVTVSAIPHGEVCPVRLLHELQKLVESDQESFVFRGFNGRLRLRARARLNRMWKISSMISFYVICRCGLVEYLGFPQRISARNLVPNRAEVVVYPPRPTRGSRLSYGASMVLGPHGIRKSVTWKRTGCPSCP